MQTAVALWLDLLTEAAADTGPASLLAGFPFFSPLLLLFLRSLVSVAVAVGREGSSTRSACLSQCVQLLGLLQRCLPELSRVEALLLTGGEDEQQSGSGSGGASQLQTRSQRLLMRASSSSSSSWPSLRASKQQEADAARSHFLQLTGESAEASEWLPCFQLPPAAPSCPPSPLQQMLQELLRLTMPSSLRHGAAAGETGGGALPLLSRSSSFFRSQLLSEEKLWSRMQALAASAFRLQPEPVVAAAEQRSSSNPAAASPSLPRSLSPDRLSSDRVYHRLSATGRAQLKAGLALCSRRSAAIVAATSSADGGQSGLKLLLSALSSLPQHWREQTGRVAAAGCLCSASLLPPLPQCC